MERMCKRRHGRVGLHPEWAVFRMCGEASYRGKRLTLAERGRNGRFKINDDEMMCAWMWKFEYILFKLIENRYLAIHYPADILYIYHSVQL